MAQKTIQEIVNEISVKIVDRQALDCLRKRCLKYAKSHREWREEEQLCLLEDNLYFKAVEKYATLRNKQKPPHVFKKNYHRFATEYAKKPRYNDLNIEYLNDNQLLQLLHEGIWDWQWQDMPGEETFTPIDKLAALEKFPELRKRWRDEERTVDAIPDNKTKQKVLDYVRNISRNEKNEINRHYEWLSYDACGRDNSGWLYTVHSCKDLKLKKLIKIGGWVPHEIKYILSGWTPPKMFPAPNPKKHPWPYFFHGPDRIRYAAEEGSVFRLVNTEAKNDRLAMCLLLALVHDEFDPEPRIVTDEIKRTIPDWMELVPDFNLNQDELPKDMEKAWNYVEADLMRGEDPPDPKGKKKKKRGLPEGDWVGPISKVEMARRFMQSKAARWRKVQFKFPSEYIEKISERTFRFRIDHLDKSTQTKCRKEYQSNLGR